MFSDEDNDDVVAVVAAASEPKETKPAAKSFENKIKNVMLANYAAYRYDASHSQLEGEATKAADESIETLRLYIQRNIERRQTIDQQMIEGDNSVRKIKSEDFDECGKHKTPNL